MESLIERFDLDLRDAVDERRERSVRLKYAELRMISVYEELQVMLFKDACVDYICRYFCNLSYLDTVMITYCDKRLL